MYSTTSVFFTISLLFILLNQVSSLYCFACLSSVHATCYCDPKRSLQVDCSNPYNVLLSKELARSINSSFESPLSDPLEAAEYLDPVGYPIYHDETEFYNSTIEFDCVTIMLSKVTDKGQKSMGVLRGCMPKNLTCDEWKMSIEEEHESLKVKNCVRCSHHLCNHWSAANYLEIGMLSFLCPFVLILIKM